MSTEWFVGPGEEDNKLLGEWLRQLRHTAGLSRAEAASKLDFTSEYLRLIESGKRTPDSENMNRICDVYEVIYQQVDSDIWRIDDKTIVFTNRILEARQRQLDIDESSNPPSDMNKLEMLGWIVNHLSDADDLTLNLIKKALQRDPNFKDSLA